MSVKMDFLFFITLIIILLIFIIYKMQPILEIAPEAQPDSPTPPKISPNITKFAQKTKTKTQNRPKDGYFYNPENDIYELYTEKMPKILAVPDHVELQ